MRLVDSTRTTSHLYGFIEDSVIPEGTIKLVVTLGEPPQTASIVINFLTMNCPSAFNGVTGRLLLRALKAVMSIYSLTMKFPTAARIGQA